MRKKLIGGYLVLALTLFFGFNINVNASELTLTCPKTTINIGETVNCDLKGPSGVRVWKSKDKSIATTTQKGVIAGRSAGTVKIIGKVNNEKATVNIKVTNTKLNFSISGSSQIKKGTTNIYRVSNANTNITTPCKWSTGNSSILRYKLNSSGYQSLYKTSSTSGAPVYGVKAGTARVKVTCGIVTKTKRVQVQKLSTTTTNESVSTKESNGNTSRKGFNGNDYLNARVNGVIQVKFYSNDSQCKFTKKGQIAKIQKAYKGGYYNVVIQAGSSAGIGNIYVNCPSTSYQDGYAKVEVK